MQQISRKSKLCASAVAALSLCAPQVAQGHSFGSWDTSGGGFFTDAQLVNCGAAVGPGFNGVHGHTMWSTAPLNGYVNASFQRQRKDGGVFRNQGSPVRFSGKNTRFEGFRKVLHYKSATAVVAFDVPTADASRQTRVKVTYQFKKDDAFGDTTVRTQVLYTKVCVPR